MAQSNARISRVHGSWRVRVFGYPPEFFADSAYGGDEQKSLRAARRWRDARWIGVNLSRKRTHRLTPKQRNAIRRSTENYNVVAARYGISPNYVHKLRRTAYE